MRHKAKIIYLEGPVQHLGKQRIHLDEDWLSFIQLWAVLHRFRGTKKVLVGNHKYNLGLILWIQHKHVSHLFNVVSRLQSSSVASDKDTTRKQIKVVILRRISGTLEHVQHLLSHQETTW